MSAITILQERWNIELEQAVIRFLIGLLAGIFILIQFYIINPRNYSPVFLYVLGIYLTTSITLIVLIFRTQSASFFRRLTGIIVDISGISFTLYNLNEAGLIFFSLYIWVIMGNGLRYGKSYLYISMFSAIIEFSIVVTTSTFWLEHFYLSIGILIGIIALPLYFSKLLTRLTIINTTLERRVNERTSALKIAYDHALAANKAKTQFLANMSHELRTPLNAIIGYSEILEEEAYENTRTKDIDDLKKIKSAGKHLLDLINQILDLNKIESGEMSLKRELVEVKALLNNIADTIQPMLKNNQNVLTIDIDPMITSVSTDKLRIRQVLLNLASNANKFTKDGSITLNAILDKSNIDTFVKFIVRDTGIGISQQDLTTIFDPFTQVDNTYSRQYQGSGLGLAISQNLCRMMGGELTVESELGKGSVFTVVLPIS